MENKGEGSLKKEHSKGDFDRLTLSAGQAVVCFEPVAEQDEGPLRGRAREVDHLHAGLQREVVTQVQQMLQLCPCAGLRRHLLEKGRHPEKRTRERE